MSFLRSLFHPKNRKKSQQLPSCSKMASSKNATKEIMCLAAANNHLAIHLHRLLAKEKTNVFFSPFSVSTAMAMVFCAAEGQTESEMINALGYKDAGIGQDNLAVAIKRLMSALVERQNGYTLTSANSILFQKDLEIKEGYKSVLTESFQSLLMAVDFERETKSALKQINDWVKEETSGMIPTLIESLDPRTVIVLLNAVYFKGSWMKKFNKNSTSPGPFFNYGDESKKKDVDMMKIEDDLRYTDTDLYQALQLPYVGEDIAMIVLLPKSKDCLGAVEESLKSSFVSQLDRYMVRTKVKVTLPRFRLDYSKSLVPLFKQMGIQRLFCKAELGGISDSAQLKVSEIFHKAVLEVNEEGSEAAVCTTIDLELVSGYIGPDPEFKVDHPFMIVIYDNESKLILFIGRVEEL